MTQQYFDKRRSLAMGIVSSGIGVIMLIGPLFTRVTVDAYGWRGTMLLLSAITLHGIPLSMLIRPVSGVKDTPKKDQGVLKTWISSFELRTFCTQRFLLLTIGLFIYYFGHFAPFAFLGIRAVENGMTKSECAIVLMSLGLSTGIGRFVVGVIGNFRCINRALFLGLSLVAAGLMNIGSYFISVFVGFIVYAVSYGLCCGKYLNFDKFNAIFSLYIKMQDHAPPPPTQL